MDTHPELDFPVSEAFSGIPARRPPQVQANGHHIDCTCEVCWYAWESKSPPLTHDAIVEELGARLAQQRKLIRSLKRDLYIQTRIVNPPKELPTQKGGVAL